LRSTKADFYHYSAEHEDELTLNFANAMALLGSPTVTLLVEQYLPLKGMDDAKSGGLVLDVGGGDGYVSIALARRYPSVNFTVLDLPTVVKQARQRNICPEDVRSQVSYVELDIMAESADFGTLLQTCRQGEAEPGPLVYLIKQLLHDFDDSMCLRLLTKLACSLRRLKDMIVILDTVIPEVGARFVSCASGIIELSVFGGKHRTLAQWGALFDQVRPKVELHRVLEKTDTTNDLAILELRLE
jgi:SAM-dependent methyltransferase